MNERLIVVMIHKSERWKSNQKKNLVKKKKTFQDKGKLELKSYLTPTSSIRKNKKEKKEEKAEYCHSTCSKLTKHITNCSKLRKLQFSETNIFNVF